MSFTLPPRGVEVVLLALVLAAAVYDVRYRIIPNWLTAAGVVIGLALNSFVAGSSPGVFSWGGLLFGIKGMALGFAVYFVLYIVRAKAAGDVKLTAAVGALVGWQDWFGIFLAASIASGILAVVMSAMRGRLKTTLWNVRFILSEMKSGRPAYLAREELDVRSPKAFRLPGGFVAAIGTIIFLAGVHITA
jgi:prepilin peptidase CpaA